jgi:hypothetical protein
MTVPAVWSAMRIATEKQLGLRFSEERGNLGASEP